MIPVVKSSVRDCSPQNLYLFWRAAAGGFGIPAASQGSANAHLWVLQIHIYGFCHMHLSGFCKSTFLNFAKCTFLVFHLKIPSLQFRSLHVVLPLCRHSKDIFSLFPLLIFKYKYRYSLVKFTTQWFGWELKASLCTIHD